ncbi:MAG: P-loop NTPase [Acidobacteria bacterium]|nr:P-loop NTPase [Acidobacteriota bacterium]
MNPRRPVRETELTALLVSPDREMAESFLSTVPQIHGFQILADMRTYPTQQTLEIRLHQLQPEVALIDVATNVDAAVKLIAYLAAFRPPVHVVALHSHNDSEAILRAVRAGACEFLYAPFDPSIQLEAIARLRRLRQPETSQEANAGRIVAFSSAKPGSGASTLATQTAFALKRATGKRVLLADFDLAGGTVGFFLKLNQQHSLLDVMSNGELDTSRWPDYTVSCGGVDILTAPDKPHLQHIDPMRLQESIQYMRFLYDWVIVDLPSIFHRISLLALSETERAFLVSTSELPSLHLTRKAVSLLNQLGFAKDRVQVVVNRVSKKDGLAGGDLGKLFDCPVQASFPNDYFSLHRVITLGRPLANDCELGRAVESLAGRLVGGANAEKKRMGGVLHAKPALSEG